MTLYVLRHAIASRAAPGQADSARQVTDRGRRKARRVLSRARRIGVRPSTVLTSPYIRATQTADIALEELGGSARQIVTETLLPYASVFDLWEQISLNLVSGDVLVVGHNPQLSALVAWMLGAREDTLWLKKSGLVKLDFADTGLQPRATLSWLLTPRLASR